MSTTKIITVRIDEDLLQELDRYCKSHRYPSRNALINCAIRFVVAWCKVKSITKLVRFWPQGGDIVDKIEFEYHRQGNK